MEVNKKVYTVVEVADILGVKAKTIRGYIKDGDLKAMRIGSSYRITQAHLDEFFDARTIAERKKLNIPGRR